MESKTVEPVSRPAHPQSAPDSLATTAWKYLSKQYLVLVLVAIMIAVGMLNANFWGPGNLENILFRASFVGLAACGMTLLIAAGSLDLSAAGVIAISGVTTAKMLSTTSIPIAIMAALAVGILAGLINGFLVTYVRIAPFIATLGTLNLFVGVAFIWTSGSVVPVPNYDFSAMTNSKVLGIPLPFVVLLFLAALTYIILYRTYWGRTIRAVGSNEVAARLAGMPTNRARMLVFAFAGACSALAGVFMTGRLSSAEATMATGFEMNVIAAVVVGGTALRGGRGTAFGTLLGSLLFAVLANALNMLGVASYWQYVLTGTVLVIVIAVGARSSHNAEVRGAG